MQIAIQIQTPFGQTAAAVRLQSPAQEVQVQESVKIQIRVQNQEEASEAQVKISVKASPFNVPREKFQSYRQTVSREARPICAQRGLSPFKPH